MDIDAMGYKIRDLLIANQQLTAQVAELQAFRDRFSPMLEEAEAHYLASRPQAPLDLEKPAEVVDPAADQKPAGEPQDDPPVEPAPASEAEPAEARPEPQQSTEQPQESEQQAGAGEQSSIETANSAGEPQDAHEGDPAPTPADNPADATPDAPQAAEQP
ncbi:hypothetical protein [Labrys neptuniae]